MRHRPAWAPDEVDIEKPSVARMYDYLLGGSHNFAADRALAEQSVQTWPDLPELAKANRAFLHRAVRFLCEQGVDQFLDLGSGIPTRGNVHEIALETDPASQTVYVDVDPIAAAHGKALLADVANAHMLHADLRDTEGILHHPIVTERLDFSRPVGVLMASVLPWIPNEDDPVSLVAAYRDATVSGSYLALTHGTSDFQPETTGRVANVYKATSTPGTFRSREQIAELLAGYDLVEPGMVSVIRWRPDPGIHDPFDGDESRYSMYAAIGVVP